MKLSRLCTVQVRSSGDKKMVEPEVPDISNMLKLVELNLGRWKPFAVLIVDINFKVWGQKGEIPTEALAYFKKFPIKEMHPGDSVHNSNAFLMKITEKTGIIVGIDDIQLSRLAAINLRGRISALSNFYNLEKFIQDGGT